MLVSGYSRWRVWLSSVAESSTVGGGAWAALEPLRLLKRCPIMSRGRIPPWKRAQVLGVGGRGVDIMAGSSSAACWLTHGSLLGSNSTALLQVMRGNEGCDNKEKRVAWAVLVRGARVA